MVMKYQYGWVVVAAGALMGCVAMGATFSLAVFLQPMSEATGWSRTGVSMAMTIVFITMGIGGFVWGALTDRFRPKVVVLSGALLLGAGLALASRATSLLEFQLVYGILVGGSAGSIFAPMIATVTGWFEKQKRLAVALRRPRARPPLFLLLRGRGGPVVPPAFHGPSRPARARR